MTHRISPIMTRREFMFRGALLAGTFSVSRWDASARAIRLHVGVVESPTRDSDYPLGLELGLDEAKHAASLFGAAIETTSLSTPSARDAQLAAIIGGGDDSACLSWAQHAAELRIVYLNASCASDELRSAKCSRAAFHVTPSAAMYRDASALLPGVNVREVTAWHPSLTRFGADTLNKRFQNRFGRPMTADAWAAWLAVKILWEASLAAKSGEARAIADHLERDTTKFDGHKGQPLSFRAWDHQLRQPVYAITIDRETGARTVREVPEPSASGSTREALDRIGESAATSACRFAR
jgi:hypothetical protein